MKILLTQISLRLGYSQDDVRLAVAGRLQIPEEAVLTCYLVRRAIDARGRHRRVCFIANIEAELEASAAEALADKLQDREGVQILTESQSSAAEACYPEFSAEHPPVVVGAGPAGLLAAWKLAMAGAKPILIERGAPVEQRRTSVSEFWDSGQLDREDNVLFGEGGAGLFSDGKLITRSKMTSHVREVLELLVQCGAPDSILIDVEAHVGSDLLGNIVVRMRERIEQLGGQVRFGARLDGLEVDAGQLVAVVVNGERIATNHCVLATGHSARDVYHMLHHCQIPLLAKAFAVGVRLEMPQSQIDSSQYGPCAGHPRLGAAGFRLTRRGNATTRACYSFCMCPGGSVIACASSEGQLTTNGMSMSTRSSKYGCAAFLVPATPEDYNGSDTDPLAGVRWQEAIEARAFETAGGDYSLPACRLTDFLAGRVSDSLPRARSCSRAVPANLHEILPAYVTDTLVKTIKPMMQKLIRVPLRDVLVYGPETRSSSPVRIARDESLQSPGARGLYPSGEGSGYAGGIITSAVDGLRAAESVLQSGGNMAQCAS